ncbi:MAG: hypothetical protein BWK76_03200 [Desulfobulbaceae bacterium A2]|nr:MAG: hypothetical protein BWK76_03200 [Desulfobulbaceae bacterium A2]
MPGSEVDGFRIEGLLHEGGMAVLYQVSKADIDIPLLMKVPRLGFGNHPACYVGFEMEQMIYGAVSGPHVPHLVAQGGRSQLPYLVLERIDGPGLREIMEHAPLPVATVARLMSVVAAALHDIHRQNVIHLDLKPANVLFRPDGQAVLIDFGLAHHGELPDLVEEEFHAAVGTGAYISPEQLLGCRSDPRSDIYALGVVAYQMASGKKPFGDPSGRQAMRRRLFYDAQPPWPIQPQIPPWLQETILRCLELDAEDRYATAAQLAHDLAHPEQIMLTERATRVTRGSTITRLRRWFRGWQLKVRPNATPSAMLARAPHVLVALDLDYHNEALDQALRDALQRALIAEPQLRITLITVRAPQMLTDEGAEALRQGMHIEALMQLRHWAHPLEVAADKLRLHVAQNGDSAAALLDYATTHHVDRIIMGARGASRLRRYLGSVSARVVTEARCSVSVIRPSAPYS